MKNLIFFIVEDDALFTQLIVDFINKLNTENKEINIKYHTFYSLKEAKYELKLNPDFILLDYLVENDNSQPENALSLVEFLENIHSSINVIIISGNAQQKDISELHKHGIKEYIPKDKNTFIKLKNTIQNLI